MKESLKSVQFRLEREKTWRELERLLERAERGGTQSLGPEELVRLPALYRATVAALSVARAISLDKNLLGYLEALSVRAYFTVYGTKRRAGEALGDFFGVEFPGAVRRHAAHVGLAALFLFLGYFTGFYVTKKDPGRYYEAFVSPEMASGRTPEASAASLRQKLFSGGESEEGLTFFAAFLFTHNTRVGFLCFALGFALGIPVFYLLFLNGMTLGAMSWLHHDRGLALEWWSWILPHGVTEMLAIVLCGAAGLAIAHGIVFPGRLRRIDQLAAAGRRAGQIAGGAVLLFLVAGLIEGLFRQLAQSVPLRYLVAMATTAFWIGYFTSAGRGRAAS